MPAVAAWFETSFPSPTQAQSEGWASISRGEHTLILAPTGSGKTLAAFLWGINQLISNPPVASVKQTRIIYISPLRALAVDIERNLAAPLVGVGLAAQRLGIDAYTPTVGVRSGDTPTNIRRQLVRTPPDILITTPESLYLMLTSAARETLVGVETVIIDEIHALTPTKRGSHLALSLERLEEITASAPQRIGLSATQRPLDEIARFLGGKNNSGEWRPVTVVDAGSTKELDVSVVVPVDDMAEPATDSRSIWPAIHPSVLSLVREHRSTLIFVNARRSAERLATRLNELAIDGLNRSGESDGTAPSPGTEVAKAHHGSLSRERRGLIEDELKRGELKALVATSSLELGIDMGAVDLVVQVESPGSVARGLQRIGRAGHQVGEPSRGRIFPKHRGDLLEAAVVVQRMKTGAVEATRYPRNPLDVLAQQIVAMAALDDWSTTELAKVIRRAAPYAGLSDDVFEATLDLLSGRYPSDEFSDLSPRLVWDRIEGTVRGRKGAQRLAVTNAGTIPDRGLFGVFLPDGTRVGELDEEMVYESRVGETFLLGATAWRVAEITHERVVVTPAPGRVGRMPFWRGDSPGRPLELGEAVGAATRHLRSLSPTVAYRELRETHGLDGLAAKNLMAYFDDQGEATGAVPDDKTIVVERFRDEIGDWRVCVLSPFGAQVHAPWAIAMRSQLEERWGVDIDLMWSDDGIAIRLPEAIDEFPLEELLIDPDDIDRLVTAELPNTALFAARFRECAGRSLLLPRRRPGRRTPLWQQRQRAADLLKVASAYPSFPILLETTRECLNDVFDLPALRSVLRGLQSRSVRVVAVNTPTASPFAQSLMFGWIGQFMYELDAPLAERRAAALSLDKGLLRELLGAEELRDLLDPQAIADVEDLFQRRSETRAARDADELHDTLVALGPLSEAELCERSREPTSVVRGWLSQLETERRVYPVTVGGAQQWASTQDAGRLRDAFGIAVPVGLPSSFTDSAADPLGSLLSRYALSHGPFLSTEVAARFGLTVAIVQPFLERMEADGTLLRGEFRPQGFEREWCDPNALRLIRRRSLARLRNEVEAVDSAALGRFLPVWQGIGGQLRGLDGLVEVLSTLQGASIPVSSFEKDVLASRVAGYRSSDLDALCIGGELLWVGAGGLGATDGRIRVAFRDQAHLLLVWHRNLPGGSTDFTSTPTHEALLSYLHHSGASFWPELVEAIQAAGLAYSDQAVLGALWDLVWAGHVTNDSFTPLRALGTRPARAASAATRRRGLRAGHLARLGPPGAAGRWSLVAPLLTKVATPAEVSLAQASTLLERYGVLTREAALGEGLEGGFAGVYPVLKELEERGRLRRGYFVAGLGAAQFALPGAVDRLRDFRESTNEVLVLAATDPAQPYGAAIAWPPGVGRPSRSAGAYVVLGDGSPVAYLERGGRSLLVFVEDSELPWVAALADLVEHGRLPKLEITKINGVNASGHPLREAFLAEGFVEGYRGLVRRATPSPRRI